MVPWYKERQREHRCVHGDESRRHHYEIGKGLPTDIVFISLLNPIEALPFASLYMYMTVFSEHSSSWIKSFAAMHNTLVAAGFAREAADTEIASAGPYRARG